MPPDPAPPAAGGLGQRPLTVPTDLRSDHHDLVHLLDRQQPAEGPAVSRLAAALPAGGPRPALRRDVPWIGRGGDARNWKSLGSAALPVRGRALAGQRAPAGASPTSSGAVLG